MNPDKYDVVVIGAGPSGMMAAVFAKRRGLSTAVIDDDFHMKKLLLTGKGRCNLTNNCNVQKIILNAVRGGKFLYSSLSEFSSAEIMDFFSERGVDLVTERGDRVFPASGKSYDIVKTLIYEAEKLGVTFIRERAKSLIFDGDKVSGVAVGNGDVYSNAVIVATGGLSYPSTGSRGEGYEFARQAGHHVVDTAPSLVGIICRGDFYKRLSGLSLRNVELSVKKGKKQIFLQRGEMLFTDFGISGPLVLTASAYVTYEDFKELDFSVDLKPALSRDLLDKRVLRDFAKYSNRELQNGLGDLLPKSMIPEVIATAEIDPNRRINEITAESRRKLVDTLKSFPLTATGTRSISEAVVTAGGVDLKEIYPKTMMSKKMSELYFCGEVLNTDALTGGYNLTIAFSTGAAAGRNVLKGELK
ncbi:MAG: NAD(P)/FAD-dependent oxidoreductase [Ruminococcaceae bacterium]|nr:NAD(P)/FAD-dependent oxidoreductase [Oscillospiraceae bacterium]